MLSVVFLDWRTMSIDYNLDAESFKRILVKALGSNDDVLTEESNVLLESHLRDNDLYSTLKGCDDLLSLAKTMQDKTGNVRAALSIINFYLTYNAFKAELFPEFLKRIVKTYDHDKHSHYEQRWPTDGWKPYVKESYYDILGMSCPDKYGHMLSDTMTYVWLLQNVKNPSGVLESLGLDNAAKLAYFAEHVICPKRLYGDLVQLDNRIINLSKRDPDTAITVIDVLTDPGIMTSDVVIDLDELIDKASSGLPASFLAEPLKIGSNTDDFMGDIHKTVSSIKDAISNEQDAGLYISSDRGASLIDSPLSVPAELHDPTLYLDREDWFKNIIDLFIDYDSYYEFSYNGRILTESELRAISSEPDFTAVRMDLRSICMDLRPTMFRKYVRVSNLLKAVPHDMWSMLDIRVGNNRSELGERGADCAQPGCFRVLMPTDELWSRQYDDYSKLFIHDSRKTMLNNAEQVLGHGVDGTWRWMIWTRIQYDMSCIMKLRKRSDEPVFRTPGPAAHTIPPKVMEWVTDGVIPKSIAYKDEKRHKVKMNLTSASDKWFFWDPSGERWHLSPYDVLKAMPKTWSEALSCMKKNHDDSPVRIYDRALKDSIRFHNPNGRTTYSYEQYIQKQDDYQKEQEGFI